MTACLDPDNPKAYCGHLCAWRIADATVLDAFTPRRSKQLLSARIADTAIVVVCMRCNAIVLVCAHETCCFVTRFRAAHAQDDTQSVRAFQKHYNLHTTEYTYTGKCGTRWRKLSCRQGTDHIRFRMCYTPLMQLMTTPTPDENNLAVALVLATAKMDKFYVAKCIAKSTANLAVVLLRSGRRLPTEMWQAIMEIAIGQITAVSLVSDATNRRIPRVSPNWLLGQSKVVDSLKRVFSYFPDEQVITPTTTTTHDASGALATT